MQSSASYYPASYYHHKQLQHQHPNDDRDDTRHHDDDHDLHDDHDDDDGNDEQPHTPPSPNNAHTQGRSRSCSVKGCPTPLPASSPHKMCPTCRERHRAYAMTKRAKRRQEKAAVMLYAAGVSETGDVVWANGDGPPELPPVVVPEGGQQGKKSPKKTKEALATQLNQMYAQPYQIPTHPKEVQPLPERTIPEPTQYSHWESNLDPRLFASTSTELAGALTEKRSTSATTRDDSGSPERDRPKINGPGKYCSVKGCKAIIPADYFWKMCEPCRDRYRGYGNTKRAKWKREREQAVELAEKLKEAEDRLRPPTVAYAPSSSSELSHWNAHPAVTPQMQTQPPTAPPASAAPLIKPPRMCSVSHCHKILTGDYPYKRCQQHRVQNRHHSKLKRVRDKEVKAAGPDMSEFMDGSEDGDGEFGGWTPTGGGGGEQVRQEHEPEPIKKKGKRKGHHRSEEPDFPPLFTNTPIANGERTNTFQAIPPTEFDYQSPTALSELVRRCPLRASYVCSLKTCENLLDPRVPWKMCDDCREKDRIVRKRRRMNKDKVKETSAVPAEAEAEAEAGDGSGGGGVGGVSGIEGGNMGTGGTEQRESISPMRDHDGDSSSATDPALSMPPDHGATMDDSMTGGRGGDDLPPSASSETLTPPVAASALPQNPHNINPTATGLSPVPTATMTSASAAVSAPDSTTTTNTSPRAPVLGPVEYHRTPGTRPVTAVSVESLTQYYKQRSGFVSLKDTIQPQTRPSSPTTGLASATGSSIYSDAPLTHVAPQSTSQSAAAAASSSSAPTANSMYSTFRVSQTAQAALTSSAPTLTPALSIPATTTPSAITVLPSDGAYGSGVSTTDKNKSKKRSRDKAAESGPHQTSQPSQTSQTQIHTQTPPYPPHTYHPYYYPPYGAHMQPPYQMGYYMPPPYGIPPYNAQQPPYPPPPPPPLEGGYPATMYSAPPPPGTAPTHPQLAYPPPYSSMHPPAPGMQPYGAAPYPGQEYYAHGPAGYPYPSYYRPPEPPAPPPKRNPKPKSPKSLIWKDLQAGPSYTRARARRKAVVPSPAAIAAELAKAKNAQQNQTAPAPPPAATHNVQFQPLQASHPPPVVAYSTPSISMPSSPPKLSRVCANKTCSRTMPSEGNASSLCERCKSRMKKRQAKARKRFHLVPKLALSVRTRDPDPDPELRGSDSPDRAEEFDAVEDALFGSDDEDSGVGTMTISS